MGFLATDWWANGTAIFGTVGVLAIGWLSKQLIGRWRRRRQGTEAVRSVLEEVNIAVFGEKKTRANPTPPPGLMGRMGSAERSIGEVNGALGDLRARVETLDRKVTPNGGNTRALGDMLVILFEHLGIPLPPPSEHDAPPAS